MAGPAATILALASALAALPLLLPATGSTTGTSTISSLVAHSRRRTRRTHAHPHASRVVPQPPAGTGWFREDLDVSIFGRHRQRIEGTITRLRDGVAGHHDPFHDAAPRSPQQSPARSSLAAIASSAVS